MIFHLSSHISILRYQPTTIEKVESDIGFTVRKKMNVDDLYMDRDSQVPDNYVFE